MHQLELALICFCYLIAMSFLSLYLKRLTYHFLRLGRWFLGIGVALQWGFVITWFISRKTFVPSNSFESQLIILTLLASLCWMLSIRKSLIFLITIALPLLCLGLVFFEIYGMEASPTELPNPWLWTHIVFAVLGDGFFFFAALISVAYLGAEFQFRKRLVSPLFSRLPSLVEFDRILGEALLVGFVLLTLGLLMGFFFAQQYWSVGWLSDAKVVFSFLSWMIYAVLLFLRALSPVYRGRRSALLSVFGFVIISGMSLMIPSKHHQTGVVYEIEKQAP